MKQNKYDNPIFFDKYKQMARSVDGLKAAGEWHIFQKLLPSLNNKRVLDLGCGFGWHCQYAVEQGASSVVGIDISEKMLNVAREMTPIEIQYLQMPIEDINFLANSFDVVISSLTFHYIASFSNICAKVYECLAIGAAFVFSVEHPIFTANSNQQWCVDNNDKRLHWPIDNYFDEDIRKTNFLEVEVLKYHRTLTTYINTLIECGFKIISVIEPQPDNELLKTDPLMQDELRRPMMLIISVSK
ncbi:class I SAM-dependent methyltransferase [Spiroplasma endosymbiont of Nephrotoma flavescens]|uniref:class I SAM-dependent methyltransferase n=1 Tax=Spiroplasma endosymbiont of Nephrotoma flavescens TaxID=3066302 RepID=UPI00313EFDF5